MTTGQMMFYGGIAGVVLSGIIIVIALGVFNKRRQKKLQEIIETL